METTQEFGGRFARTAELVERPSCVIYKGLDKNLSREVAIKVFVERSQGNPEYISAFEAEVSLLRAASHPSLVPIIAGGETDGWFYIAMELIQGPTLRDMLKERGKFEVESAVDIIVHLASALAEIHEKQGMHGHIDSRAVLFKNDSPCLAGYYPKTIDRIQKNVTGDGRMIIDPAYIAPEQIERGDGGDGRADIYALSILLFEMLTGSKPFSAKNQLQLAMMRLNEQPPSAAKLNPEVPRLLDAALLKGMAKDPEQRYRSVADYIDAITGGKKKQMNPLADPGISAAGMAGAERLEGTQTIAVSMSADSIKQMLAAHEAKLKEGEVKPKQNGADTATMAGRTLASSGQLDASATMVGMDTSKLLKASLFVTAGPKRGQKYLLDKPQTIIGSDVTCEFCIADKEVPRRYAIIAQRGSDYSIEALSGSALKINGHEVDPKVDGVLLKRGDVINVGAHSIRFIAPGEVFTLQDDVADRVIDRPKSRMVAIMMVLLITSAAVGGGGLYLYQQRYNQEQAARDAAKKKTARERQEYVAKLIQEGDQLFKDRALTQPVGANAKEKFQAVLEADSENGYAKTRLGEIRDLENRMAEEKARKIQFAQQIEKLTAEADNYFRKAEYIAPPGKNARDSYQQVLHLDAENENAKKRIAEIDKIIGDLMSRVGSLLEKARGYMEAGQYVLPKDENAYDTLQQVLKVDPSNAEAKEALLEMAARSIYEGDRAKASANVKVMRKSYLTAQALGLDPDYIKDKLQGIDTMMKSQSAVVVVDRKGGDKQKCSKDARYLDCDEVEKRAAAISLKAQNEDAGGQAGERSFIELNGGHKSQR